MVFGCFGGSGCFFMVLVVLAVAGKAPWGTNICMFCDGFCGSGCFVVVLVVLAVAGRAA